MAARFAQVMVVLLFVAAVQAAVADPRHGRYAAQLQAECMALVADAVQRPYGLAWGDAPAVGRGTAARPVTMEPGCSPAAGVLLLWSGELLDDDSLRSAAKLAAGGVAASQAADGRIAPIAMFGESPEAKPHDDALTARGSTVAGMALLLAVLDTQPSRDPVLAEKVDLASRWLRSQQSNGGWTVAGADGEKAIALDAPGYRDCTFAMLLEADVLDRQEARQSAEQALSRLMSLRLTRTNEFLPGAGLWTGRYNIAGDPIQAGRPADTVDLLASRYAAQTCLAASVRWGQRTMLSELERTAERLTQVRRADGNWKRFEPTGQAAPAEGSVGEFGLPSVLASTKALKNLGPTRYRQLMARGFDFKPQLIVCLTGLGDDPFALSWPVAAAEVDAYVQSRSPDWKMLQDEPPKQLTDRLRRLWILFQRARLEAVR